MFDKVLSSVSENIRFYDHMYGRTGDRTYVLQAKEQRDRRDLIRKAQKHFSGLDMVRFSPVDGVKRFDPTSGKWEAVASIDDLRKMN